MNDYRKPYQDTSKQLQAQLKKTQKTMEKSLLKAENIEQKKSKLVEEYHKTLENWLYTLQQKIPDSIRSHSRKLRYALQEFSKIKSWATWWWPVFVAHTEIVLLYIKIGVNTVLYKIYSVLHFFYINRGPIFAGIMLVVFLYLVINMIPWPIKP